MSRKPGDPGFSVADAKKILERSNRARARTAAKVRKTGKLPAHEKHEQRALFAWAELYAGRWPELNLMYAIPNAGGYTGGYGKNRGRVMSMKKEGVRSGVPDVHLPVARRGFHSLYIELKPADGGKGLSSDQEWWIRYLLAEGHKVFVCLGAEDAERRIAWYLG